MILIFFAFVARALGRCRTALPLWESTDVKQERRDKREKEREREREREREKRGKRTF